MSYWELDGGLHTNRWEWVPVVLLLSVGVAGSGAGWSIFSPLRVNCAHKVYRYSTAHDCGFIQRKKNDEMRHFLYVRKMKDCAVSNYTYLKAAFFSFCTSIGQLAYHTWYDTACVMSSVALKV